MTEPHAISAIDRRSQGSRRIRQSGARLTLKETRWTPSRWSSYSERTAMPRNGATSTTTPTGRTHEAPPADLAQAAPLRDRTADHVGDGDDRGEDDEHCDHRELLVKLPEA